MFLLTWDFTEPGYGSDSAEFSYTSMKEAIDQANELCGDPFIRNISVLDEVSHRLYRFT